MTATATPRFHEFYCIDRNERVNRAMVVYQASKRDEFKPLHMVMNLVTGTRWVTSNAPSANEVIINELTFNEQIDERFDSAIFAISNDADDRAPTSSPSRVISRSATGRKCKPV